MSWNSHLVNNGHKSGRGSCRIHNAIRINQGNRHLIHHTIQLRQQRISICPDAGRLGIAGSKILRGGNETSPSAGGLETLALIAERGQSDRAKASAIKVLFPLAQGR